MRRAVQDGAVPWRAEVQSGHNAALHACCGAGAAVQAAATAVQRRLTVLPFFLMRPDRPAGTMVALLAAPMMVVVLPLQAGQGGRGRQRRWHWAAACKRGVRGPSATPCKARRRGARVPSCTGRLHCRRCARGADGQGVIVEQGREVACCRQLSDGGIDRRDRVVEQDGLEQQGLSQGLLCGHVERDEHRIERLRHGKCGGTLGKACTARRCSSPGDGVPAGDRVHGKPLLKALLPRFRVVGRAQ